MGNISLKQGKIDESIRFFLKSLEIYEKNYGPNCI